MPEGLFLTQICVDWSRIERDTYLRGIPAVASLTKLTFERPVTFFVGENGSGKSTLLEAMAVSFGFNPEGGSVNYRFSTFDSHSELHRAVRLVRGVTRPKYGYFLRAESFYNVATADEAYSRLPHGVPHRLHEMSHGESFLAVARENFCPEGIYFLDEPEAALSPQGQMSLLLLIAEAARQGAQFFIATHSPILLALPEAEILSFDGGAVHPCAYEETGSYRILRMFVNDRAHILRRLFGEEAESE